jgi:hypothetical protein
MTARRMISGDVLKYLKGLGLLIWERYSAPFPAASRVLLTLPPPCLAAYPDPIRRETAGQRKGRAAAGCIPGQAVWAGPGA